jgi:hypothetical protein
MVAHGAPDECSIGRVGARGAGHYVFMVHLIGVRVDVLGERSCRREERGLKCGCFSCVCCYVAEP